MLIYKAAYKLVEGVYRGEVLDYPGNSTDYPSLFVPEPRRTMAQVGDKCERKKPASGGR